MKCKMRKLNFGENHEHHRVFFGKGHHGHHHNHHRGKHNENQTIEYIMGFMLGRISQEEKRGPGGKHHGPGPFGQKHGPCDKHHGHGKFVHGHGKFGHGHGKFGPSGHGPPKGHYCQKSSGSKGPIMAFLNKEKHHGHWGKHHHKRHHWSPHHHKHHGPQNEQSGIEPQNEHIGKSGFSAECPF